MKKAKQKAAKAAADHAVQGAKKAAHGDPKAKEAMDKGMSIKEKAMAKKKEMEDKAEAKKQELEKVAKEKAKEFDEKNGLSEKAAEAQKKVQHCVCARARACAWCRIVPKPHIYRAYFKNVCAA